MKYTVGNLNKNLKNTNPLSNRILSTLGLSVEAVPVPHDDPIDVIPGPNPTPDPASVDPSSSGEEPVSDEQEFEEEHDSYGFQDDSKVPADGIPSDKDQVEEYSKKTSDITGMPALDAEELDGINSLLGTASFSFNGKSYEAIRLDGSWYIKGEQEDGGSGAGGSADDSTADEKPAEDQKSGEEGPDKEAVKHEPPPKKPKTNDDGEGQEKHEAPSQKKPDESHEIEAPQSPGKSEAAMRVLSSMDFLGKDFNGQPEDAEMTGVGTGMTEESITPDIAPGFAVTRDRLAPGDPEMEGHEDPSQSGVNAPSMASPMALENLERKFGKPTEYDEGAADRGELMLNTVDETTHFLSKVTRLEFKQTGYFTRVSKAPVPKDRLELLDRVLRTDHFRKKGKIWVKPIDHTGLDQSVQLRKDGHLEVTTASLNGKTLSVNAQLVIQAMARREAARLEEQLDPAEKAALAEAVVLLKAHFKASK